MAHGWTGWLKLARLEIRTTCRLDTPYDPRLCGLQLELVFARASRPSILFVQGIPTLRLAS